MCLGRAHNSPPTRAQPIISFQPLLFSFSHPPTPMNEVFQQRNPRFKTKLCQFVAYNKICPFGSSCSFAHTTSELRSFRGEQKKSRWDSLLQEPSKLQPSSKSPSLHQTNSKPTSPIPPKVQTPQVQTCSEKSPFSILPKPSPFLPQEQEKNAPSTFPTLTSNPFPQALSPPPGFPSKNLPFHSPSKVLFPTVPAQQPFGTPHLRSILKKPSILSTPSTCSTDDISMLSTPPKINNLIEKEEESHFIRNIFNHDESDEDDSLFSPIELDFSPSPDKKSPFSPSADNKTSTLQDDEFDIFTPPADTSIMLCTFQTDDNPYDPMTRTCCNNNNLIGLDCGVPARALGGSAQRELLDCLVERGTKTVIIRAMHSMVDSIKYEKDVRSFTDALMWSMLSLTTNESIEKLLDDSIRSRAMNDAFRAYTGVHHMVNGLKSICPPSDDIDLATRNAKSNLRRKISKYIAQQGVIVPLPNMEHYGESGRRFDAIEIVALGNFLNKNPAEFSQSPSLAPFQYRDLPSQFIIPRFDTNPNTKERFYRVRFGTDADHHLDKIAVSNGIYVGF